MDPRKTPTKDTPEGGGRKALIVVGVLGAIAVNIAAFVLSAAAITAVAEAAGISKTIAWAMVAAVDGLMITGTVVFIANKLRSRSVAYPLTVLASGVLLSIVCNALHSKAGGGHIVKLDDKAKMAVSAIPAVSLALSFHLIAEMVKDSLGVAEKAPKTPSAERLSERPPGVSGDVFPSVFEPLPGASPRPVSERPSGCLPEPQKDAPQTSTGASPKTPEQTLLETLGERPPAPAKTPGETPKTPSRPRRAVAKQTPKAPAKGTREQARELLRKDPDMNAADLARALDRKPSGYVRTLRTEVLTELADAGEIERLRAVSQ